MKHIKSGFAGAAAGVINGLLGAGGGMILVPLLSASKDWTEQEAFPASVAIILPLCVVSLIFSTLQNPLPWQEALPYLIGAIPGGLLAGLLGKKIPVLWLHRILGAMILWGGLRYLWS